MHHLQTNKRTDSLKVVFICDTLRACADHWTVYNPPACPIAFTDALLPTEEGLEKVLDLCEENDLAGRLLADCSCSCKHKARDRVIYYKSSSCLSRGEIDKFLVGENGLDVFRTNPLLSLYFVDVIMHDILRVAVQGAQSALNSSDLTQWEFPDFTDRPYLLKNTINYRALHFLLRYSIGEIYGIFYDWMVKDELSFTQLREGLSTDISGIYFAAPVGRPSRSELPFSKLSIFVKVLMSRWLYVFNDRELSEFRLARIMPTLGSMEL
ncbi:hypothetical protein [Marinobacterium aestuarii]|uniref:hypothetical protein n=1 Tax=Marinobacterium aestuarii TaxID=1821621 RepID=UPI000A3DD9BD|nr:hypothetical protein [Marinobacterium aestuarii]